MSSNDSRFFLVWQWHTRHTARIDLRRRRSNSRPRSVGILRVRGLPLLRRVQMMKRHHVQLDHRIHRRQSWRRGSRCGLKGENTKFLGRSKLRRTTLPEEDRLKAKALTVFVMPGCAKETPFSGPKADRPSSSLAIPGFSPSFTGRRGSWKC